MFIASDLCYVPSNTISHKTNAFIASDETVSTTYVQIHMYISYCRQSCLSLAMNAFCAEGKHLTLETSAFLAGDEYFRVLETNALKTPVQISATRIHN